LIQPSTSSRQIKVKSACPSDRHKFDLSDCQPRQVNSIVPISSDAAAAKIGRSEALAMFREAMVEQGARRDLTCNICNNVTEVKNNVLTIENNYAITGNSKAYTVSRLKNNRPDLFEKVVSGE
jgi:hypothetical protein